MYNENVSGWIKPQKLQNQFFLIIFVKKRDFIKFVFN